MARDDEFQDCETTPTNTSDLNNSIVKKVTSLIPTSISKWFNKNQTRRRDSDSDDDSFILEQPPTKRARIPNATDDQLQTLYMSNKLPNGSCTKKTQVHTTELLNNIRPRQSFNRYNRNDEPVAGPSGLQDNFATPTVKRNINGDSGGSTSGCSSMAQKQSVSPVAETSRIVSQNEQKKSTIGKRLKVDTPLVQSPRTLFGEFTPPEGKSLASRRPSFNPSAFGKTPLQDNTLTSERVANSPFYAGRTMFGGASSYPRQLFPQNNATLRNSIQVKPANEHTMKSSSVSMSQTARRIMDVLENYSTPVEDAKKIPRLNFSSRIDSRDQTRKIIQRTPYSRDVLIRKSPPIKGLTVPKIPSMAEVIELRRKLQSANKKSPEKSILASTSTNTLSTSTSTSAISSSTSISTGVPTSIAVSSNATIPKSTDVPFSSTVCTSTSVSSKTNIFASTPKTTSSSIFSSANIFTNSLTQTSPKVNSKPRDPESRPERKRENLKTQQQREDVSPVDLPNIPLPITNLPKFEFTQKAPEATKNSLFSKALTSTPKETKKLVTNEFEFVSPIPIDKSASISKNLMSINNFKFSKPLTAKTVDDNISTKLKFPFSESNSSWDCPKCFVKNNTTNDRCTACKFSKPLTTKNNDDNNFKAPKQNDLFSQSTSPSNSWNCTKCFIKNNLANDRCVACTTLKPGSKPTTIETIKKMTPAKEETKNDLSNFTIKANEWECASCMVRNLNNRMTCLCCEAPRPSANSTVMKNTLDNTWKCQSCLKRNNNDVNICTQCSANRFPGFTKKANEWECPSCMIRNATTVLKCVCCETPKPGTEAPKKNSLGSGGIQLTKTTEFKFGIDPTAKPEGTPKPTTWECPSCMVRNKEEVTKCVCCETAKPGTATSAPKGGLILEPTTQFKFGIDKVDAPIKSTTATTSATTFTFGSTTATPPKTSFTFGIQPESKKYDTGVEFGTSRSPASNQFGSPKTVSSVTYSTSTTSTINFGGGKTSMATFGAPNQTPISPIFATSTESKSSSFGSPVVTSTVFGSNPTTTSSSFVATTTSTLANTFSNTVTTTVGSALLNTTVTTVQNAFGNTTTTNSGLGNTFGNVTPALGQTFGNTNTTTSSFGIAPAFGGATTTGSTTASFESSTTTTSALNTTPTPSFGASTFGSTPTTTSNLFGSFAASKPADTKFSFTGNSSAFTFGNTEKVTEEPPKVFGGSTFSFDTKTQPETPKPMFGGFNNTPAPNFGASSTSTFGAVTQASTFGAVTQASTFGAVTQAPTSTFGNAGFSAPTFGTATTQASNSFDTSNWVFGAPAAQNTWGQNNTTAFQFGASSAPTQPSASLFSFGGNTSGQINQPTATPTPGAFSFSGNNTPAQPSIPTFNPNTKPVFNFSSGAPAPQFTAQPPGGGPVPPQTRRYKKAVRRNPRPGP